MTPPVPDPGAPPHLLAGEAGGGDERGGEGGSPGALPARHCQGGPALLSPFEMVLLRDLAAKADHEVMLSVCLSLR